MNDFFTWLDYVFSNVQGVLSMVSDNWLLSVMFWFSVIYLVINAVKLKRNTE